MERDKIILNGSIADAKDIPGDIEGLLSSNYIYQRIHVSAHRPLYAKTVIELAGKSLAELYDATLPLSAKKLEEDIVALMSENRYPKAGSNIVTLYLMPEGKAVPHYMLSVTSQLVYRGYTLWHTPKRGYLLRYDHPFPTHKTGVSLMTHNYATQYVARFDADTPLTENYGGILTGAGEYPLFAVSGSRIITTSLDDQVPDSVERRICLEVCAKAGYEVSQEPIRGEFLGQYDELFYFAPQGVYPIRSCGDAIYPDIVARRVANVLRNSDN